MVSLSDDELTVITDLARPLPPASRSAFLAAVVEEASKYAVLGPGLIARIAAGVQKTFLFASERQPGEDGAEPQRGRRIVRASKYSRA
jgi:hypothetical protein